MTRVDKLERDFQTADLAAVNELLMRLTPSDVMARASLEARRREIETSLQDIEAFPERNATAALFFSGAPVNGQRGIESEFAAKAVGHFQTLVTTLFAEHASGGLARRGPLPRKAASALHITNIVRGSFGFLFEEPAPQAALVHTALSEAVGRASQLIQAFGDPDEEAFRNAVADVDQRVLGTAKSFFELLKHEHASFRLVAGETEANFLPNIVALATERADATDVVENERQFSGFLAGLLPEAHVFEFRSERPLRTIMGKVAEGIEVATLEEWNRDSLFQDATATINVKEVKRSGETVRESFTLTGLALSQPQTGLHRARLPRS